MHYSTFIKAFAAAIIILSVSCNKDSNKDEGPKYINGHEYVDLGLPSGLKWATQNVGATKPSDFGHYYAWGEHLIKADYTSDNYLYYIDKQITKYSSKDALRVLVTGDDAAASSWGGSWRMPTQAECQELLNTCTFERIEVDGITVSKVTGPNGNSIIFPLTGLKVDGRHYTYTTFYWSSSAYVDFIEYNSWALEFFSDPVGQSTNHTVNRWSGCPVRPVSD